jgi:hypothetical protein
MPSPGLSTPGASHVWGTKNRSRPSDALTPRKFPANYDHVIMLARLTPRLSARATRDRLPAWPTRSTINQLDPRLYMEVRGHHRKRRLGTPSGPLIQTRPNGVCNPAASPLGQLLPILE